MRALAWLPTQRPPSPDSCYWGQPARSGPLPTEPGAHHRPERAAGPLMCGICGARWDGIRWSYAGRPADRCATTTELSVLAELAELTDLRLAPRWRRALQRRAERRA